MNKKKFAVILSGCGVYDGAEIHEAVLTLLAIASNGAEYQIFAPDIQQHHVKNHLTGEEMNETRNVLVESARIARGKINPLSELKTEYFDAIIFPGGFGVAKNLSNYAFKGADLTVNPQVEKTVKSAYQNGKPIGVMCIAPVIIPKILGNAEVTIGSNAETAANIEKLGGRHIKTTHGGVVVDEKFKIVSTPCYMLDATIDQIAEGADNLVKAVMKLVVSD
jgi:enhancing lycopene biosynthesis protein 2